MRTLLWIVLLLNILWVIAMSVQIKQFDFSAAEANHASRTPAPVGALELAATKQEFLGILCQGDLQHNIAVMRTNTQMDFVFIALYSASLFLLAAVNARSRNVVIAAGILIAATALFDIGENLRLFGQFNSIAANLQSNALPRPVSLAKWTTFAASLIVVAIALVQARPDLKSAAWQRVLLVMVIASVFLAAAVTLVAVFKNELIGLSILALAPALLLALVLWSPWARSTEAHGTGAGTAAQGR